jgi:hypothetical protein
MRDVLLAAAAGILAAAALATLTVLLLHVTGLSVGLAP